MHAGRSLVTTLAAILTSLLVVSASEAQHVADITTAVLADILPSLDEVVELRARVLAERRIAITRRVRLTLAGTVEGLLADRAGGRRDAIARPRDVSMGLVSDRFDLVAGYTRVAWGRLDELQPTDVINPIDITKFFLEGRSEARMAVALVRARWFLPASITMEGVLVPDFRPGSFDELDEARSPFNLVQDSLRRLALPPAVVPILERAEPAMGWRTLQGGARLSATTRRVDWSLSFYRGFESVGRLVFDGIGAGPTTSQPIVQVRIRELFPRFTMIGGDFETVRGAWALRGEVAAFVDRTFQPLHLLGLDEGHGIDAGVGVERKAGDYRLSGTLLFQQESSGVARRSDLSLIVSADRRFARDTRVLQSFIVWSPTDESAFARIIGAVNLRDNVWLEGSGGWFIGRGDTAIGRFADRDFLYARLKVYF